MGRATNLIIVLVFLDLIFLITGQYAFQSPGASLLQVVFQPELLKDSNWWGAFFNANGTLLTGIGIVVVATAAATRDFKTTLAVAAVATLSLLATDFIAIYIKLQQANPIIALLIFSPLVIYSAWTAFEWVLQKD